MKSLRQESIKTSIIGIEGQGSPFAMMLTADYLGYCVVIVPAYEFGDDTDISGDINWAESNANH